MPYLPTINNIKNNNQGNKTFDVTWKDGVHPNVPASYDASSLEALNIILYKKKVELDNINYSTLDSVAQGAFTPIAPQVTPPTAAQDAMNVLMPYQFGVQFLANLKTLGWITGSESQVVNAKNIVMPVAVAKLPALIS